MSFLDRCLAEADHALRTMGGPTQAREARPDKAAADADLNASDSQLAASLMRVNHAREIAAQALYRGQALVADKAQLRDELLLAAEEEHNHLAWCQERTEELGGRTSLLAPLWYAGSFAIGVTAGLAGDKYSLGFLDETEQQVAAHLSAHLERLPAADSRSREILERMRADELRHGHKARELGGASPPAGVKKVMRALSTVMTSTAFRI